MGKRSVCYLGMLILFSWSCSPGADTTEKHQKKRDNIVYIKDKVKEIKIDEVAIGHNAWPYIADNYLIIVDYNSYDKQIHILDKNNLRYITSLLDRGGGPQEIGRIGKIWFDTKSRQLYILDHAKQKTFSLDLDSALQDSSHLPKEKMKMDQTRLPIDFEYMNDTLSVGIVIEPIGSSDFRPFVARWNMITGEIVPMKYQHPEIEKPRITFAASQEHDMYVECFLHHDLFSICTLDGELKYNVYGRTWDNQKTNSVRYYKDVAFCGDRIFALYSEREDNFPENKEGKPGKTYPTAFLVFDLNGDYIKTLELGYEIVTFCYDVESNRIILVMDDEYQFAYLDLDELL